MYTFNLKKKTLKRNQVTAFHIIAAILLIVIGFITIITPFSINFLLMTEDGLPENALTFSWVNYTGYVFLFIGLSIMVVSMFFNKRYLQKRNNLIIRIVEIICFALILIYCIIKQFYLPGVYAAVALLGIVIAYYMEHADQKPIQLVLDQEAVSMQSKIKSSQWKWAELNHFILKHNVITINNLEDKMYQFIVEPYTIDAAKINEFALKRIEEEIPNRNKHNW